MKSWKIRALGIFVLVGLLLVLGALGGVGGWEAAIWFVLVGVVLFAPIPRFLQRGKTPV